MAVVSQILGAAGQGGGLIGSAFAVANTLFQKQVQIRETANPANIVNIEVTDTETLPLTVTITDKPVANIGATVDYITRQPIQFTIAGVISNRNLDIRRMTPDVLQSIAGGLAPSVAAAIGSVKQFGSYFTELGEDEIDKKIKLLRKIQRNASPVDLLGLRLDSKKYDTIGQTENFVYLIEDIQTQFDKEAGDNVQITIVFKQLLGLSNLIDFNDFSRRGAELTSVLAGSSAVTF